jgi:hypothetical protein
MQDLNTTLYSATNSVFVEIAGFLPSFLGALLTLIVGFILAGWVKVFTVRVLRIFKINKLGDSEPLQKFFHHAQIGPTVENILGESFRILIITIFLITSMNMLGLSIVTQVLSQILSYIPTIIAAIIIFVGGVLIAGIVEKLTKGALGSVNIKTARTVAKIASYSIMVITALAAISQLGIAQSFINTLFTGLIATLVLGLGLSIGLGGKDLVKTILEDWYKDFKKTARNHK